MYAKIKEIGEISQYAPVGLFFFQNYKIDQIIIFQLETFYMLYAIFFSHVLFFIQLVYKSDLHLIIVDMLVFYKECYHGNIYRHTVILCSRLLWCHELQSQTHTPLVAN